MRLGIHNEVTVAKKRYGGVMEQKKTVNLQGYQVAHLFHVLKPFRKEYGDGEEMTLEELRYGDLRVTVKTDQIGDGEVAFPYAYDNAKAFWETLEAACAYEDATRHFTAEKEAAWKDAEIKEEVA